MSDLECRYRHCRGAVFQTVHLVQKRDDFSGGRADYKFSLRHLRQTVWRPAAAGAFAGRAGSPTSSSLGARKTVGRRRWDAMVVQGAEHGGIAAVAGGVRAISDTRRVKLKERHHP